MDIFQEIDLKRQELCISMDQFIDRLGFDDISKYDEASQNGTLTFEQFSEVFRMFDERKQLLNMPTFDIWEVIENRKKSEKVSNGTLAKALGISETVFANRYSRKSFSFDETMRLCDVLNIDLNELKRRASIKSEDIYNMLRDISYRGMNNYYPNARAMEKIKQLLGDSLVVEDVSKDVLFEFGFWTLYDAPDYAGYGIREAQSFLNSILGSTEKVNIDFMAGIVCCGFMGSLNKKNLLSPKGILKNILDHVFEIYDSTEIAYIFDRIKMELDMSKPMGVFLVRENLEAFIEDVENWSRRENEEIKIILEYTLQKVADPEVNPILQYTVKNFVMMIQYLYNGSKDKKIDLI